ncbi:tetratricopeptide repeat protein [Vibrio sp.]|uniref:tetratricopeptide repeat protein n=1 Tax=Vibrio sp. TaxID=678 RepID=UPI003D13345C
MNDECITIARQLLREGDFDAARHMLNEILTENPQDVTALVCQINALGNLGLLEEALRVAQTAFAIEPDNPEVNFGLSWVYYKMRELHKARNYAYKAVTLAPEVAKYQYGMVPVSLALRDGDTALEYIETAHRLDPSIFNTRAHMGLWGLRIVVGLIKLKVLVAWGIVATFVLLRELGPSWFLLKLLVATLPFVGASVYYLIEHRYRRAAGAFVLGLLWSGITWALAQWLFLR